MTCCQLITDIFYINAIYPRDLEVLNTNVDPFKICSFLDLHIEINDGKFTSKVYD